MYVSECANEDRLILCKSFFFFNRTPFPFRILNGNLFFPVVHLSFLSVKKELMRRLRAFFLQPRGEMYGCNHVVKVGNPSMPANRNVLFANNLPTSQEEKSGFK